MAKKLTQEEIFMANQWAKEHPDLANNINAESAAGTYASNPANGAWNNNTNNQTTQKKTTTPATANQPATGSNLMTDDEIVAYYKEQARAQQKAQNGAQTPAQGTGGTAPSTTTETGAAAETGTTRTPGASIRPVSSTNKPNNTGNTKNPNGINPTGIVKTKQSAASPEVEAAQQTLDNMQNDTPQGYNTKYGPQIDALIEQIQQPRQFNWDFNGDELFKYYADLYAQNGRQASMDAMGQAAALTGGYGNSYAQQVGNQAYDEWLRALYDKGIDLRDRAYEVWQNEGQDLYNQLGALQSADQMEWERMTDQQKYYAEFVMQILANGQMPSDAMLAAAGLTADDAKKLMAKKTGGGGVGTKKKDTAEYYYLNGDYYKQNNDKSWEKVSTKDIDSKDIIDTKLQRTDDWTQAYLDAKKKHDAQNHK